MTYVETCCLCNQIAGKRKYDLISQAIDDEVYIRRVPLESTHFAVIPSVGPVAPGHSLLCPRVHSKSCALLSEQLEDDFQYMKSRLGSLLSRVFHKPVHYFEHGSAPEGPRIVCTVDHAHLHFVPADVDPLPVLQRNWQWLELGPRLEDLRRAVGEEEYLYYEAPDGQRLVATANGTPFASQCLRRVFATALGRGEDWDWRNSLRIDEVDKTFRHLMAEDKGSRSSPDVMTGGSRAN